MEFILLFVYISSDRPNTPSTKHQDSKDSLTPNSSAKHKNSTSSAKKSGNVSKKIRHR